MIERGQIQIPVRIAGKWVDMDLFDAPEEDFRRFVFTQLQNLERGGGVCFKEQQAIKTEKEANLKERG